MLSRLSNVLRTLRNALSNKAENAYLDRDVATDGSNAESYAEGEAHAYGVSSDEVRAAEAAEKAEVRVAEDAEKAE